jgi:hypothetical protein
MAGKHWLQQAAKTAANKLTNCCKQAAKLLQTSCSCKKLQKCKQLPKKKQAAINLQKCWLNTSCKAARLHNCPLPIICSADWLQLLTQLSQRKLLKSPYWGSNLAPRVWSKNQLRAPDQGGGGRWLAA